jgi:carotenoid 1,2-hydratase
VRLPAVPGQKPGAYRWYYADVTAEDFTAVAIFMVGSVFTPGYPEGDLPHEHCAVNFALYHRGLRRQWVLSEYPGAAVDEDERGQTLRMGGSRLRCESDGRIQIQVSDRSAPWGSEVSARFELTPQTPKHPELQLVPGLPHFWQPIAPRCKAKLVLADGVFEGIGYHDTNRGEVPLGSELSGWQWSRTHGPQTTQVHYQPNEGGQAVHLESSAGGTSLWIRPAAVLEPRRTLWGLAVPRALGGSAAPRLLESSPFYARMESRTGDSHVLCEVADFVKFRRPWLRWMTHFRSRKGNAA